MKKNRILEKTVALIITLVFTLSPLSLLRAEDFPAGYLGNGYRGYLSDKIQTGYYVEVFTDMQMRQKERVSKRNEIEKLVNTSYQATPQANNGLQSLELQKKYSADNLKVAITEQRKQREQFASVNVAGGFTYIPHSDGQIDYFKDGTLARVENERVIDEFGNVGLKNTYNIQYNDKRLMLSYEANLKDNSGNITYQHWYGANYTADSLFYGTDKTVANRNLTEYYLEERDPAGNTKLTHWNTYDRYYNGKTVSAFSQSIDDSVYGHTEFTRSNITYVNNDIDLMGSYYEEGIGSDGLTYTLQRDNVTYNGKDQITGLNEETTVYNKDGTIRDVTKVKTEYIYEPATVQDFGPDIEKPDPDRLAKSVITYTTKSPDGATKTETTITNYDYNSSNQIISALGTSTFTGGDGQGNNYQGTSEIRYSLYHNRPESTLITTTTDYLDKDGTQKHEDSVTNYIRNWYGILTDANGIGEFSGNDGQGNNIIGTSSTIYKVINGKAVPIEIIENINS